MLTAKAKAGAFLVTGSGAMLSEAVHTLADLGNQYLLKVGVKRSSRTPDYEHPFVLFAPHCPRSSTHFVKCISASIWSLGMGMLQKDTYSGLSVVGEGHRNMSGPSLRR